MTDRQKRILMGLVMGIAASLFVHHATRISGFVLTDLINGYEYKSYDSRMKSRASFSEEASIDDVVIIDIEQNSVESLGNYHEWPHAYHGQLTDMVNTQPLPLIFRAMPPQGHNGKGALYFIKNIYMKKPNESQ